MSAAIGVSWRGRGGVIRRTAPPLAPAPSGAASGAWPGVAAGLLPPAPPAGQHGQQEITADRWPVRSFLELGAIPEAVPYARGQARRAVLEWGLPELIASAEVLVSELVTNAVAVSSTMQRLLPVRMWLLSDAERVLILVWDASGQRPERSPAGDDAEGGRGLVLVEAMSERWDWYFPPEPGGKVVWALVSG